MAVKGWKNAGADLNAARTTAGQASTAFHVVPVTARGTPGSTTTTHPLNQHATPEAAHARAEAMRAQNPGRQFTVVDARSGAVVPHSSPAPMQLGTSSAAISWQGTGTNDHAATARYHEQIAAHHEARGEHTLAAQNRAVAAKYHKRAGTTPAQHHTAPAAAPAPAAHHTSSAPKADAAGRVLKSTKHGTAYYIGASGKRVYIKK